MPRLFSNPRKEGPWRSRTRPELKAAKKLAQQRLHRAKASILPVFSRTLDLPIDRLHYDEKGALKRIDDAAFVRDRDDIYGETDGESIWISRTEMTTPELVNTLVHEALHDSVTIKRHTRGNDVTALTARQEHACMRALGECSNATL